MGKSENALTNCVICGDEFIPDGRRKARCSKVHKRSCALCGTEFTIEPNMKITKTFCSYTCSAGSRTVEPPVKKCVTCGNDFATLGKTCSNECRRVERNRTTLTIPKKCGWCGEEFFALSTRRYCEGPHSSDCEVCGRSFSVEPPAIRRTCSSGCQGKLVNTEESWERRRATSRKNWGTDSPFQSDEIKKKTLETNMSKFGYSSPLGSPELRDKGRARSLEVYGHINYAQSEEGKKRRAKTNKERYGAENPFSSPELQDKIRETNMELYGVPNPMQNPEILARAKKTTEERYGFPNVFMNREIKAKAMETFRDNVNSGKTYHRKVSKVNKAMAKEIEQAFGNRVLFEGVIGDISVDLQIERNDNADIYLDIHPTVSHNSKKAFQCFRAGCSEGCLEHSPLAESYHSQRAKLAQSHGITLIQVYDWDSVESVMHLLRPRLLPLERIGAKRLQVRSVTPRVANEFLAQNHVQGAVRNTMVAYGLFRADELFSVATFGEPRFGKRHQWEFTRYASRSDTVVMGASSRLFARFVGEQEPDSVISYLDFNHTTRKEGFMDHMGFRELKETGPTLIWHRVTDGKTVKNNALVKLGADRLLGTSYGPREICGLGNREIMLAEGFLPVHTAGSRVFEWKKD